MRKREGDGEGEGEGEDEEDREERLTGRWGEAGREVKGGRLKSSGMAKIVKCEDREA